MNTIMTNRCKLSPLSESDFNEMTPLFTDGEARKYLGGARPLADAFGALRNAISASAQYPYAVRLRNTNEFIGYVSVGPHHNPADMEISYIFLPEYWGNGYARETIGVLLDFCKQDLKLHRVVSETQTANVRSCRLLEKLGYTAERKIERFDAEQTIYVYKFTDDMEYTLHPMQHSDYDEIYALWQSIPGVGLSEADSRENIDTYLSRNPGQSFVCKQGDTIAGTILCGNDGRRAYIHHTAVAPIHRRHGVAVELVRQALEVQRGLGMKKCHLFIFNENELGKAFWSKVGFTERQDIGIMSKNL